MSENDKDLPGSSRVEPNIGDSLLTGTDSGVSVEDFSSRVTAGLDGVPIPSTQSNSSVTSDEVTPPMPVPDREEVGDVLELSRGVETTGVSSENSSVVLSPLPTVDSSRAVPRSFGGS